MCESSGRLHDSAGVASSWPKADARTMGARLDSDKVVFYFAIQKWGSIFHVPGLSHIGFHP